MDHEAASRIEVPQEIVAEYIGTALVTVSGGGEGYIGPTVKVTSLRDE